jgi:hypothetical protein
MGEAKNAGASLRLHLRGVLVAHPDSLQKRLELVDTSLADTHEGRDI